MLAASAPAIDAPISPRPMTATAEKGALAPFSSADSVMGVSVSSIDQVPVTTHCIRSRRPRAQNPPAPHFPHVSPPPQCLTGFRLGLYTDGAGWLAGANGGYLVFKFIAWRSSRFPWYRERLFHFLALTVRSITAIITRTNVSNCVQVTMATSLSEAAMPPSQLYGTIMQRTFVLVF